jgi:hypothetical protein
VQGYNAQTRCTRSQIVIAAEVTNDSPDFGHLAPMIVAAEHELAAAGITDTPAIVLADAGYWHQVQMEQLTGRGTVAATASIRGDSRQLAIARRCFTRERTAPQRSFPSAASA